MKKTIVVLFCVAFSSIFFSIGCKDCDDDDKEAGIINCNPVDTDIIYGSKILTPNPQPAGDIAKGKEYLLNPTNTSSGFPIDIFRAKYPISNENVLERTGINATLLPQFTALDNENGVKVVVRNCLECHGSYLNGEFYIGLGNINADFTVDQSLFAQEARGGINYVYGPESKESEAFEKVEKVVHAVAPHIITDVVGANPGDWLSMLLGAHRDPQTMEWSEETKFSFPNKVIPTDVPPWWVLKKKDAALYTGMGKENYAKLFMGASTLTLESLDEINQVESEFNDIMAYIRSIEPPEYPYDIDQDLASQGKLVFNETCSSCHGTYGDDECYPNLLFPANMVGTDPAAIDGGQGNEAFNDWFNSSYYATIDDEPGKFEETGGYVAQPLDGIWASAPYLHNGSVPTLYEMLNSSARVDYWRRTIDSEYDKTNVGWKYTEETSKTDKFTYDTNIYGYGNQGHIFGDALTDSDRMAVIEYLKTL